MINNLENEINQELKKDKLLNFYKKNKIKIISLIIFLIILIFGYQFRAYYINKKNSEYIEKILLSTIYLDQESQKGIDSLNEIKDKINSDTIVILSSYQLIDFYLKKNNKQKALEEIIYLRKKLKNNSNALELINIKEAIIRFDQIEEKDILKLLKNEKKENFMSIKKKLFYDFYTKKGQLNKAKQFILK